MRIFLISLSLLLTGCATIQYEYKGRPCETLGFSESQKLIILRCPSPYENWHVRERK